MTISWRDKIRSPANAKGLAVSLPGCAMAGRVYNTRNLHSAKNLPSNWPANNSGRQYSPHQTTLYLLPSPLFAQICVDLPRVPHVLEQFWSPFVGMLLFPPDLFCYLFFC